LNPHQLAPNGTSVGSAVFAQFTMMFTSDDFQSDDELLVTWRRLQWWRPQPFMYTVQRL